MFYSLSFGLKLKRKTNIKHFFRSFSIERNITKPISISFHFGGTKMTIAPRITTTKSTIVRELSTHESSFLFIFTENRQTQNQQPFSQYSIKEEIRATPLLQFFQFTPTEKTMMVLKITPAFYRATGINEQIRQGTQFYSLSMPMAITKPITQNIVSSHLSIIHFLTAQ